MSFGDMLKQNRQSLRLSQTELGEILGVGKTTIINWEKGKTLPKSKSMYKKIEAVLNEKKEEEHEQASSSEIVIQFKSYLDDTNISNGDKAKLFIELQNTFISYIATSGPAG